MTRYLSSVQGFEYEYVASARAVPRKRSLRMVGAGLISAALVSVCALPAYASATGTIGTVADAKTAYAQALTTAAPLEILIPAELPSVEQQPIEVVAQAAAEENEAAPAWVPLPTGSGVSGIVNAALAQIGMEKDCTDVAQDSLAAIGLVTSRFDGGPDLGVGSFAAFGAVYAFSPDGLAPGDLLVWPNAPHVAVYVGDGQVVHGGWRPTTLAGLQDGGVYPEYVVRIA